MSGVVNGRFLVVVAFVIERDHHVLLLRRVCPRTMPLVSGSPGAAA
jgi:hypothetical protein